MIGPGKLRSRQERAVAALIDCPTLEAAATAAGVGSATLRRWLREDDFVREYRRARAAVVESAVAAVQQAAGQAVATLVANLTAPRPSDQIKAAALLLDHAHKGVELIDHAARLDELEARLAEVTERGYRT